VNKIEMDVIEIGRCGMDWIGLAEDMERWRVLVNTIMNFGFRKIFGKLFSSFATSASKVGLKQQQKTTKSVVCVQERTKPTERPPTVGEISAKFCQ
jgi:hypothetical protein